MPAAVTAVAVSHCGNFGIVATASGRMDKYNMQSGLHRGTFMNPGVLSDFLFRASHLSVQLLTPVQLYIVQLLQTSSIILSTSTLYDLLVRFRLQQVVYVVVEQLECSSIITQQQLFSLADF